MVASIDGLFPLYFSLLILRKTAGSASPPLPDSDDRPYNVVGISKMSEKKLALHVADSDRRSESSRSAAEAFSRIGQPARPNPDRGQSFVVRALEPGTLGRGLE